VAVAEALRENSTLYSGWTLCACDVAECCVQSLHAASQEKNNAPVAAACRLVACILHNLKLTTLHPGHSPSACVAHAAWQGEGLPLLPSDVVAEDWTPVLEFLRVRCVCARSRNVPRARRVLRSRAPLQFPSPSSQVHRVLFRENVLVCARRRICSCRPRPLLRACARSAAPRAAERHAVAALARTRVAAAQAVPWQRAAAAAVLRQPPVRPAAPPRRCCRPWRSLQRRAQLHRPNREALLQRRCAQALAQKAMKMRDLFEFY